MLPFTDLAVTAAEVDTYATARGWAEWAGDEAAKAAALRRGQDYIAGLYNGRWFTKWDNAEAPDAIKFAIIDTARQEMASPGSLSGHSSWSAKGPNRRERHYVAGCE